MKIHGCLPVLFPGNFDVAKKLTGLLTYTPATHSTADYTNSHIYQTILQTLSNYPAYIPVLMLMSHKVTHTNLIDSSPLFHCYSTIWIEKTTLIQYNRVSERFLYEENIYR